MRINKPWGYEDIWAHTSYYAGKIIHINKKCRLSLQYHEKKVESVYVISGRLRVWMPDNVVILNPSESLDIPAGKPHRFEALLSDVDLVEVSTPEIDDVVRLDDDYGR